jgi:hypothetical protein
LQRASGQNTEVLAGLFLVIKPGLECVVFEDRQRDLVRVSEHRLTFDGQNKVWLVDRDAPAVQKLFDCLDARLLVGLIPLRTDCADVSVLNAT